MYSAMLAAVEPLDRGTVAIHGIGVRCPADCALAGTAGTWAKGHLVLVRDRQAAIELSWRRRTLNPDHQRTRAAVARTMASGGGTIHTGQERPDGGMLWTDHNGARRHAGWRHFSPPGVVIMVRQLVPGPSADITRMLELAWVCADAAASDWSLYGLIVRLPPWWRLQALEAAPGLARAVWMLRPPGQVRTQAACVLRRFALADRLLGQGTIAMWVRGRLESGEIVNEQIEYAGPGGRCRLLTRRPGPDWWSRLRGRWRERRIDAWLDDEGRLMVLEFAGTGEAPVPSLASAPT